MNIQMTRILTDLTKPMTI